MLFFWKSKKLKKLQREILKQQRDIAAYMGNMEKYKGKLPEYCTLKGRECTSSGLLMWEKDLEHRYTFANMRHCNDFYQISVTKVAQIIGNTDAELIPDLIKRTGQTNTFGEMCVSTDDFTLRAGKQCRYWEFGYIDNKIVILDVRKKPKMDGDRIIGTIGWASNLSDRECEMKTLLGAYLKRGIAKRLDKIPGKGVAAYLIKKQNNLFDWKFPI